MKHALLILILLAPLLAASGDTPTPSVPNVVRENSSQLRKWLNDLRGKSEADIAAEIGKDFERDSWQLQGKKELKLRCKFDKESTLLLLFKGEKIIKAEIYVMSEDAA